MRDHAGAPLYLALHVVDISDRVATEIAMHQSELWYRALVQHLSDLVLVIGADDGIHYVSPSVGRLLGLSLEAVVGRTAPLTQEQAQVERLLDGTIDSFQFERRYAHGDGRVRWGLVYVSLVRDAEGAPHSLLGQIEDITDRKVRELALEHDAEHEPLTGLWNRSGFCRLLEDASSTRDTRGGAAGHYLQSRQSCEKTS